MRWTVFAGLSVVISCVSASPSRAQWSVTYLHPAGAVESWGTGISGVDQVGRITNFGSSETFAAALWTGSAASFVNLNPAGSRSSELDGTDGVHQVGSFIGDPAFHAYPPQYAGMWSGTAASVVNLQPTTGGVNEPWSHALAVEGSIQVGDYEPSTEPYLQNAASWSGTSASYVALSSPGLPYSGALGTDGVSVVGYASTPATAPSGLPHAALWTFGPNTFTDLSPVGSTSSTAHDVEGNVQVGSATFSDVHAAMWHGSAASFTDLNPVGATRSMLNGIDGSYEAGTATFGTAINAGFWSGSAGSFVDLHAFLTPGTYSSSEALGIWTNGSTIRIIGSAFNSLLSRNEAVMWTVTVPEPGCVALLMSIGIVATFLRQRKTHA